MTDDAHYGKGQTPAEPGWNLRERLEELYEEFARSHGITVEEVRRLDRVELPTRKETE